MAFLIANLLSTFLQFSFGTNVCETLSEGVALIIAQHRMHKYKLVFFFDFTNRATLWCSHMLLNVTMSFAIKCVKGAVMILVKISAFVRLILY